MSRLLLFSDMHTEFHRDNGRGAINDLYDTNVDVAIAAGDISTIVDGILQQNIIQLCDKFPEVVFVSGNHEYYHSSFHKTDSVLEKLENKFSNFTWLNNTRKIISGIPFIGGTLWFPNGQNAQKLKQSLNDFHLIGGFEPEVFNRYEETVKYLKNNIQKGDVVVTHHVPSTKSISLQYINSSLNCFFVSDLDNIIKDKKPAFWFHGHVHQCHEYLYHNTHIACNPMGYPGENPDYFNSFTIEV